MTDLSLNSTAPKPTARLVGALAAQLRGRPLFARLEERAADESASPAAEAARALIDRLLAGCETAVDARQERDTCGDPPSPAAGTAARVLVTALLADERAARRGETLWDKDAQQIATRADRCWASLRLVEQLAATAGLALEHLVDHPETFAQFRHAADEFQEAIRPRRLASLVCRRQVFAARVSSFVAQRDILVETVERQATRTLEAVPGMTAAGARRLVAVFGGARLRTFPPAQLAQVGKNFVEWDPLVRFLVRWAAGERPARAEAAALEGLIARVAAIVRNAWRSHMPDYDVDDAVQDSLLAALQSLRDPRHGYTYEADLLSWLLRAALDRLRTRWRGRPPTWPLPERPLEAPAPTDELEHVRRLQEWQERYLLVQSFFRSHVRERVKAIWEAIMLADAAGGRPSDDELRAAIRDRTGRDVPLSTIAGTRRRLRQRLDALHYVLDQVRQGAPERPGDGCLLAWVADRWGLAPNDVVTVRAVAALGRAARKDDTVVWSLLARCLVHESDPAGTRRTVLALISARSRVGLGNEAAMRRRLDAGSRWMAAADHRAVLHELRGATKKDGSWIFLAPCWDLVVLSGEAGEAALAVLLPPPSEAPAVRDIARRLRP